MRPLDNRHLSSAARRLLTTAILAALATLAPWLLLLAAPDAWAQRLAASGPSSAPAAAAAPAALPIAVPDILARADEDQQRVDRARRLLEAADPAERLGRELDDIARPVDAKLNTGAGGGLRSLPVMRLESLARHWEFDTRRFERWEARAGRALAPYADSALELARRRADWSTTRAAGLLDGLPPALAARVDAMLAQIDGSEAALGARLARQFDLTRRASELKARLQAGRGDVDAAIEDFDRRLLRTDVPPLWQQLQSGISTQQALAVMHRGLQIERQFALDYNAADGSNQQALRLGEILLLPLILWLLVRSRRGTPGERAPAHVARALRRPLSSWLLLSMLGVLVLEPDAPLLVQEFALLLALVPVLRLLPAGTVRALGLWPYAAVGLYLLDRLGVAALLDGSIYRLYLLLLDALVLALTVGLLRRTPRPGADDGRLQQLARLLGWAVLVLVAIAAAANIAGNISLAETLSSGVIDSGYMALLLYAGVAASRGILHALLSQPEIAQRRLVREHRPVLETLSTRLLVLGALAGWLLYSMDRFRVLRPLHSAGATLLDFGVDVGEVSVHLGDVLVFLLSAWLSLWTARAVRRLLRDELHGHAGLPRGVGNSIASLSYYGVLLLGLLVALSAAGFKVSQLALVFGALGVGIGFGLQNVVNNFVSGLVLMFERPIQPGDVVDAAGSSGTVREIGLRATILRTFDGADVVVPNGLLLSGNLTNWTMFDRSRRIEVPVGVAYRSDPAQVLAVLGAAARDTPGVAEQPAPVVLLTGYGDSALNFVVRVWTQDLGGWMALRGELLARMLAALQQAGIQIPYQQLELHLRSDPQDESQAGPQSRR
ncbi:MAG: mechanosensitive ion channel domain-containing protein [Burkholderiaceae bacterium]